jgi:hypothetical protein
MKNLTIEQLATKRGNAISYVTENKYNLFVMDNFSKEDYIKFNQMACDIKIKKRHGINR